MTVPVPVCALTIVVGLTVTLLSAAMGGLTVIGNVEFTPAYDAVKVTAVGLATVPALSVNVVDVAPCAIVTLDGILTTAGDALSATTTPPLGAANVRATVHVAVAGGVMVNGLQENPFSPSGIIVTVPPVVDTVIDEPEGFDASLLANCSDDDVSVVKLDTPKDTVATTPLPMGVASGPESTHVIEPAVVLQ